LYTKTGEILFYIQIIVCVKSDFYRKLKGLSKKIDITLYFPPIPFFRRSNIDIKTVSVSCLTRFFIEIGVLLDIIHHESVSFGHSPCAFCLQICLQKIKLIDRAT